MGLRVCAAGLAVAVGAGAASMLAATALAAPPANDNKANALVLASGGGGLTQSTAEATKEVGEGDHAGDRGGASVWFSWTPDFGSGHDETVFIDTSGSDFDTLLDLFGPGGRTAANDDINDNSQTSRICFITSTSVPQTYTFPVDGYDGATGTLSLHWGIQPAGQPCPIQPPDLGGNVAAPKVGETLFASGGSYTTGGGLSGQWLRCTEFACAKIANAFSFSYVVQQRDIGTALRFESTLTNGISVKNTSDPSGGVGQAATTHPNGRIFWATNRDGPSNFELYSMFPDGTGLLRVTNRGGFDSDPAVTADGALLAYVQDGAIVVANPDGSDAFPIGINGTFPVWSPDAGSRVAYVSSDPATAGIRVSTGSSDNFIFPVPLGSVREIAWSPDGTKIAYSYRSTTPGANYHIAVVRADGRQQIIIGLTSATIDDHDPAWSPDGTKIAFVRGPVSGTIDDGDLYVMNADTSNLTRYVDGSQSLNASSLVNSVAWSPDGTMLVYSQDVAIGEDELFTIPAAAPGGMPTQLTHSAGRDELPFWATAASFPLHVEVVGQGSGIVTGSPPVSCNAGSCDAVFADGTALTLTATPGPGSVFAGWAGGCSGTGPCNLRMVGPRDVTAQFDASPPSGGGGGGGGGAGGGGGGSNQVSDLVLEGEPSSSRVAVGEALSYFLRVRDRGGIAFGINVDVALPAQFSVESTSSTRGSGCVSTGSGRLACNLDFLAYPAPGEIRISGRVTAPGEMVLQATVRSVSTDPDLGSNTLAIVVNQGAAASTPLPTSTPTSARSSKGVTKIGTARNDAIVGTPRNDILRGRAGNDRLDGRAGNDVLVGGSGRDRLLGGTGNDRLEARDDERDSVDCGPGNDVATVDRHDTVRGCETVRRGKR